MRRRQLFWKSGLNAYRSTGVPICLWSKYAHIKNSLPNGCNTANTINSILLISERQSQPIPVDTDCFYFVDQWKTKPTHIRGHWLILFFVDQWKTKPTHTRGHWLILFCWSVKDKANPYPWTLIDSIFCWSVKDKANSYSWTLIDSVLLISERQSQPIPVDTDWFYFVDQWKTKPTHTRGHWWFYFVDQWKTKPTHTRGHWLILFCWSVKDKANSYS